MGKTTRRAFLVQVAGAGGIGLGAALGLLDGISEPAGGPRRVRAQPTDEPEYGAWEQVPLDPDLRVEEIFTPASGALLVAVKRREEPRADGLWRSDDGGHTWRELALPPGGDAGSTQVSVDPSDHTVAYALVQGVLHRSTDDTASWHPLTSELLAQAEIRNLPIVSLADPSLLYLIVSWSRPLHVLRSRDRGESWEPIVDGDPPSLKSTDWGTRFLFPHPADASRVYLGIGYGGVTPPADDVRVSTDQGATWQPGEGPTGHDGWVGGFGAAAGAFWGTREIWGPSDPNTRGVSSIHSRPRIVTLERGTSGGTGWVAVHEIARTSSRESDPDVALAADHTRSDRLFISVATTSGTGTALSDVRVSLDGGQSWREAGIGGPTRASQLAVGIDGKLLFATGEQAVLWRLPLG